MKFPDISVTKKTLFTFILRKIIVRAQEAQLRIPNLKPFFEGWHKIPCSFGGSLEEFTDQNQIHWPENSLTSPWPWEPCPLQIQSICSWLKKSKNTSKYHLKISVKQNSGFLRYERRKNLSILINSERDDSPPDTSSNVSPIFDE